MTKHYKYALQHVFILTFYVGPVQKIPEPLRHRLFEISTQNSAGIINLGKFGKNSLKKCDQITQEIVIQVMP
jgi:hypothetical protein